MLRMLIRPLRLVAKAFSSADTPRQLAWGFAVGLLVGLVPKGNLIGACLTVVLFGTRVNLAVGVLAALAFSWVGVLLDPLTHRIGLALLRWEPLQGVWTSLYELPLGRWTGFNNTVVLGSLVLGAALVWPAYRLSLPRFTTLLPRLRERLRRTKAAQTLAGAELAATWRQG